MSATRISVSHSRDAPTTPDKMVPKYSLENDSNCSGSRTVIKCVRGLRINCAAGCGT